MKLILFWLLSIGCYAQQRFENFNELRGQKGTYSSWALVRYGTSPGDAMGGIFFWDSTSTLADDNYKVVGSWIKGRYMKTEPLSMKRGKNTFTGTAIGMQTFTFPHGLSTTPTNVFYSFQFDAPLTFGTSWTATATTISIRTNAVVSLGTFTINWQAFID